MIYRTAPFSMTLNHPCTPSIRVTSFFDAEHLRNGMTYRVQGLTHALHNSVISNDLEWLSKIFSDTKRRAVSLRQLSFLYC